MSQQFYIHGRGNSPCVNWSNAGVECFYDALINLARRTPNDPLRNDVSQFLKSIYGGGFAFDVDLISDEAKPVEFWTSMASLIAQLADEELGKAQPPEDLSLFIAWDDEVRGRWRKFLEEIHALINEALPAENKLKPLRPWIFKPLIGPSPKRDIFQCQQCSAIIRDSDDKCPDCGWVWLNKKDF